MALPRVRYISPASVSIGDTIKVTRKRGDVEITETGTIAKREYEGAFRVFTTPSGEELFRWHPELSKSFKLTLLKAAPTEQEPLW